MLEDDGFILVGRVTFQPPAQLVVEFTNPDAKEWRPALFAFRIGGEVVRIGSTKYTLEHRINTFENQISTALAGRFPGHIANPWEAFEWRSRLVTHGHGEFLARRGSPSERKHLVNRYDPPLCNDSPCARSRPPEARRVNDPSEAAAYWARLNNRSA
jgi:hypothetical protein